MLYEEKVPMDRRHQDVENRWLVVLLSLGLCGDMLNNALRVAQNGASPGASLPHHLAVLVGWPPALLGALFVACVLLTLPNAVMYALRWQTHYRRGIMKMAAFGFAASALIWMLLAYYAETYTHSHWLTLAYGQRAFVSMSFSAVLGIMLNHGRRRELRGVQKHESSADYCA